MGVYYDEREMEKKLSIGYEGNLSEINKRCGKLEIIDDDEIYKLFEGKGLSLIRLILERRWDSCDFLIVTSILNKYENKFNEGIETDFGDIETEMISHIDIDYKGIKWIIRGFYEAGLFINACREYACHPMKRCAELDYIIREEKKQGRGCKNSKI